jgi:DNA transposition AAA+ family ATPase
MGVVERLIEVARRYNWSKSEVARRSGIPNATFWQWLDGSYKGVIANVSGRVAKWLDSVEEMSAAAAAVPSAPGFLLTPTAQAIIDTLLYAQMMPEMAVINLGAGMGKSLSCQHFCDTRAHAYMVTMRPSTTTVHGMLQELAQALDVTETNPAKLDRAIGDRLRRNGRLTLLIVDEAQNLCDKAVDQLRYFLDTYGVGIALVGNEELYGRFGGSKVAPAYAQLHRRIGKRLKRLQPLPADVDMLVEAWGVTDPEMVRLTQAIGRKPGALSQISKTLQLAGMYAAGSKRDMTLADIKAAIVNRGLEDH